jgi:hypothetical protein
MPVVQRVSERSTLSVPRGQQPVIASAPEKPCVVARHPFAHLGPQHVVAVRSCPAAVTEPVPCVLVRPARALHHPVQRDPIHHDDLAHDSVLPARQLKMHGRRA